MVECEGAPRDLGLDQGTALRAQLRARFAAQPHWRRLALRCLRAGGATSAVRRDLRRHFPQQAETLDGLALGAGVPAAWLAAALAGAPDRGRAVAWRAGEAGGSPWIARSAGSDAVLRRTRPDGGFCALEATEPGLTSALAGINEAGLAAAVVQAARSRPDEACAAPALLLLRDCLARFESTDAAIDWCRRRPAGGRAELLFVDRRGAVAGVEVDGDRRRVLDDGGGLVAAGLPACGTADAEKLRAGGETARAAARELVAPERGGVILLDPAGPRLGLVAPGEGSPTWFDVSTRRASDA